MGTLLKYEFRRSRLVFLATIGITLAIELIYLIGWGFEIDTLFGIGLIAGILCIALSSMAVLLYGVIMFHEDISKKPGYLLFSTPRSAGQILGAKLLMTLFAMLGLTILFALLIGLDITLALNRNGQTLLGFIQMIDTNLTESGLRDVIFNGYNLVGLCMWLLTMVASFLFNVVAAYLVILLTKTIMGVKKGSSILAIVLWIVVTNAVGYVSGLFTYLLMPGYDSIIISNDDSLTVPILERLFHTMFHPATYLPSLLLAAVCSVVCYWLCTWMVKKKLSL